MAAHTNFRDGTDLEDCTNLASIKDFAKNGQATIKPVPLKRALLGCDDLPGAWYNVAADLQEAVPPALNPATGRPLCVEDLEPIMARALIEQELSEKRWIEIPDEVRQGLAVWRPTPLVRATGLERALATPARIYFKDESKSPPGSHKPNTAIPQVYYNKEEGVRRLTTETGAGQWGCSLAMACSLFGLECKVFMVRLTYQQRPYRRSMTRLWGGEVTPSPSEETEAGHETLARDPNCPGSLGIAISEAVETAYRHNDTKYAMGSVLNHAMLHQSIIGLEVQQQMVMFGDSPDVLIGCAGGGSNLAGLVFPYVPWKQRGRDIRFIAAESRACPTMTRGEYRYDYSDTTKLTPLVKMLTLGHGYLPPQIQAGGLRYHGMAPLVSLAARLGLIEAVGFHQLECFEAARLFAETEGVIPALETSHALRAAILEAERCRDEGEEKCIVVSFSGHGLCDLGSYDKFLRGELTDIEASPETLAASLAEVPETDQQDC